ncbi:MAG: hypothetical protein HC811_05165 [Flammeovirgaceae bacterium]|nr:hypothetical protein [Flammeovirgaceae bacterium]
MQLVILNSPPDGKGFYARDNGGLSIKYSDMNTVREVVKSKEKIMSLDLNVSGTKLVGAGFNGNVYIWDIYNDFAETVINLSKTGIASVAFAPEGRRIIAGDNNGQIKIIDNGVVIRELPGHTGAIEHIKFNHNGTFMATSSKDFSIRLWNFNQLNFPPIVLSDHDWVWSVAFTPNDEQLFAGINSVKDQIERGEAKTDFSIHAWPTKIETMAGILCGELSRNMTQEEWKIHVAEDIDYEATCKNLPVNKQ